jgi:hypothetical protein
MRDPQPQRRTRMYRVKIEEKDSMCSNAAFSRRRRWDGLVGVKLTLEGSQDQGSLQKAGRAWVRPGAEGLR